MKGVKRLSDRIELSLVRARLNRVLRQSVWASDRRGIAVGKLLFFGLFVCMS